MDDQGTNREGGDGVARKPFRFSLRTALLLFTIIAVLVALVAENHRAQQRMWRADRKAGYMNSVTKGFEVWKDHLKQERAKHPEDAEYYNDALREADVDEKARLKEMERAVDAFKN